MNDGDKWRKLMRLLNHSSIDRNKGMVIKLPLLTGGYEGWDNIVKEFEPLMETPTAFRRYGLVKVGDNILDYLVEEI